MRRYALPLLLVLTLVLVACGDDAEVAVDDLEGADTEEAEGSADDDTEPQEPEPAGADESDAPDAADEPDPAPAPEPDPERVEDPCAEHEGREMDAFLDVVSPVDGQEVQGELDLVGCANVPEGTVRYRLTAEDGQALIDDFTTAECGGPCVGEYRTTVDLAPADAHDAATLEVFWDSPADGGGEEDISEIGLELS